VRGMSPPLTQPENLHWTSAPRQLIDLAEIARHGHRMQRHGVDRLRHVRKLCIEPFLFAFKVQEAVPNRAYFDAASASASTKRVSVRPASSRRRSILARMAIASRASLILSAW